eukprot:8304503-Lingulodinium_polyedra.AAC.1
MSPIHAPGLGVLYVPVQHLLVLLARHAAHAPDDGVPQVGVRNSKLLPALGNLHLRDVVEPLGSPEA